MTEHISQQILYTRHPEPESHFRLENPSECPCSWIIIIFLRLYSFRSSQLSCFMTVYPLVFLQCCYQFCITEMCVNLSFQFFSCHPVDYPVNLATYILTATTIFFLISLKFFLYTEIYLCSLQCVCACVRARARACVSSSPLPVCALGNISSDSIQEFISAYASWYLSVQFSAQHCADTFIVLYKII